MKRGTLYRFFDAEGELLYVGATIQAATRTGEHRARDWWPEVATATFEHFPSRHAAFVAEAQALRSEEPRYNRAGPRSCPTPEEERARIARPKPVWARSIRRARMARGWSQEQLAEALSLCRSTTVSRWESGANRPNSEHHVALAELFWDGDFSKLYQEPDHVGAAA